MDSYDVCKYEDFKFLILAVRLNCPTNIKLFKIFQTMSSKTRNDSSDSQGRPTLYIFQFTDLD